MMDGTFSINVFKTHTIVSYNLELEREKIKSNSPERWDQIKSWKAWSRESREKDDIVLQRSHNEDEEETRRSEK